MAVSLNASQLKKLADRLEVLEGVVDNAQVTVPDQGYGAHAWVTFDEDAGELVVFLYEDEV